jgi:hypothetical protein
MRAYMSAMTMIPPGFLRSETPAQMAMERQERNRIANTRSHNDTVISAALLQQTMDRSLGQEPEPVAEVQAPPLEEPEPINLMRGNMIRGYTSQIEWSADYGVLEKWFQKEKKNKFPEAKTMNSMSYTIHSHLCTAILLDRGSNALMAYTRIIQERLILKDPMNAKSLEGDVLYLNKPDDKAFSKMRLGRFIRRHVLKESVLTEKAFQDCVETLVNHFFPACTFEICTGNQITQNYENCVGGGSCMSGDCAPRTAIYADNPKCFSQLIGKQNRNTARAILFHTDGGHTVLGRVYTGSSYLARMMEQYCVKQGWMIEDGYELKYKGEEVDQTSDEFCLEISGIKWHEGGVPYMDSFENASVMNDNTITLYWSNGADYCLTDTSGFLRDGCFCCCCDTPHAEEDSYSSEDGYYCPGCFEERFTTCDHCSDTTHNSNMNEVYGEEVCNDCLSSYYVTCEDCGDIHNDDDVTVIDDVNVCNGCKETKYTACTECDELVKNDDVVIGKDEQELCETCKEAEYATTE